MARVQKLPYLLPHPDRVRVANWQLVKDNQFQPIGSLLPEWDPAITIRAVTDVSIDVAGLLQDCRLNSDVQIIVAAGWYSTGTVLTGKGSSVLINADKEIETFQLSLEVSGLFLAGSIDLRVQIVMTDRGSTEQPFSPKLKGSILYNHVQNVLLEGDGARFPIEVLDFSSAGYFPADAAWLLFWQPDDLHQTVLGGEIRLYINAKHERVRRAVSENRPEDADIREAIRLDIARNLIYGALTNPEFTANPNAYPDGTIGGAVYFMLRTYFPDIQVAQLRSMARRPHIFDASIQARFNAYRES
jgi:hypothetical protein